MSGQQLPEQQQSQPTIDDLVQQFRQAFLPVVQVYRQSAQILLETDEEIRRNIQGRMSD